MTTTTERGRAVDTLQTWIIIGVPGLIFVGAAFAGRSQIRSLVGYLGLAALMVTFITVPGDMISAAVIGLVAFSLVATGRGTYTDRAPEHQETRRRYTVAREGR